MYNGILFTHKKEWNLAICNNMNGTWGPYAKQDKLEKDKCDIWSHMWNPKKKKKPSWDRGQMGGWQKWDGVSEMGEGN